MKPIKTVWDYFDDNVEYPKDVAHNTLPYGTVWCYVSSTFLNGLINYVTPLAWFAIDRYTPDYAMIESGISLNLTGHRPYDWQLFSGTKRELKSALLSGTYETMHTDLGLFDDDVVIIAKIDHDETDRLNRYMFFWFDCDVSDCCIGKFETFDTDEDVKASVLNWLEESKLDHTGIEVSEGYDHGIIDYIEMPISLLNGWLKF